MKCTRLNGWRGRREQIDIVEGMGSEDGVERLWMGFGLLLHRASLDIKCEQCMGHAWTVSGHNNVHFIIMCGSCVIHGTIF